VAPAHQFPTVRQYLTAAPSTVPRNESISVAHRIMRQGGIHHLPVMDLDGAAVIGVLTERDVLLVESLPGTNPTDIRVEEAMVPGPYEVTPDAPLAEVVATLLDRRIGSAIVVDQGQVVGVFTTVDALRALSDLLQRPE
jgi:acetoin utilization protein AcuB